MPDPAPENLDILARVAATIGFSDGISRDVDLAGELRGPVFEARCGRRPLSPILSRAPQRNYRGICQPVGVSRDLAITATTDGGVEPTY